MGSTDPSRVEQWLISFHRSLFMDDTGRIVMAVAAFAMLVLALSIWATSGRPIFVVLPQA